MSTRIVRYKIPSISAWPIRGAGTGLDNSYTVKVESDTGNIVLTGLFQGSITIAGGTAISSSPSPLGAFIAKLSPSGEHLWSKPYQLVTIKAMAIESPSNDIIVGGSFRGTVNLGGIDLVARTNSQDCFLAKFDLNGNHRWSTKIQGDGTDSLVSLVLDSAKNIIITGSKGPTFTESFKAHGTDGQFSELLGGGGGLDTWIAKYTSAGIVTFVKQFSNFGDDFGISVAVDGSDNIWLAGATSQLINVGGGSHGGGYIVQLNSDGNYLQERQVGTNALMQTMILDSNGDILIVGTFTGTIDVGGGTITGGLDQFGQPAVSAYLVNYSKVNLNWQWQTVIRGRTNGGQFLGASLVADANNIWMSGASQGTFEFASTSVPGVAPFGFRDGFIVKFNNNGIVQSIAQFAAPSGNNSEILPNAIALTPDATPVPVVTGSFTNKATFAGTTLTSSGNSDVFVGKFSV